MLQVPLKKRLQFSLASLRGPPHFHNILMNQIQKLISEKLVVQLLII